jgi:phage gp36-like protein
MYCSVDDLLTRIDKKVLINLSNDSFPADEINVQRVNETITIADDMINASLRNKYVLPLKNIPKIINQISADIVIYRLYSRRPQDVPKNYVQNFEYAIALLKDFQNGIKVLESNTDGSQENILTLKMYNCNKTEADKKFRGSFEL